MIFVILQLMVPSGRKINEYDHISNNYYIIIQLIILYNLNLCYIILHTLYLSPIYKSYLQKDFQYSTIFTTFVKI